MTSYFAPATPGRSAGIRHPVLDGDVRTLGLEPFQPTRLCPAFRRVLDCANGHKKEEEEENLETKEKCQAEDHSREGGKKQTIPE